eukprot:Lithocolla_globosa_v1_NODE_1189_length_2799_cov_6.159621.p1 type:complete len:281 gc:universal NODE_1189_length_2799_cov_6.159621:2184-1342(-)
METESCPHLRRTWYWFLVFQLCCFFLLFFWSILVTFDTLKMAYHSEIKPRVRVVTSGFLFMFMGCHIASAITELVTPVDSSPEANTQIFIWFVLANMFGYFSYEFVCQSYLYATKLLFSEKDWKQTLHTVMVNYTYVEFTIVLFISISRCFAEAYHPAFISWAELVYTILFGICLLFRSIIILIFVKEITNLKNQLKQLPKKTVRFSRIVGSIAVCFLMTSLFLTLTLFCNTFNAFTEILILVMSVLMLLSLARDDDKEKEKGQVLKQDISVSGSTIGLV